MKSKKYIVWSKDKINLKDEFQRKWYIRQVLTQGRAEDVARLDWGEIRKWLPELTLPPFIRQLWEDYFRTEEKPKNS